MNMILFILFSSVVYSKSISVKELLDKARDYSPQLKAESQGLVSSEFQIKQARLLANPVFTYQAGRLKSGDVTGAVNDLTLNQPIPWPGKRSARIDAHEFLRKLSELSKEEALLEISHRIVIRSAELGALQEVERHYQERKRRFSLIQQSLKSRPQVSPKQKADRDLIEAQMNILEKDMLQLLANKEAILWELRIYTNSEFDSVAINWETLPSARPREYYLSGITSGPRGKRLVVLDKLAANKIEQARLEARPDIMVGVNYRKENVNPVNHFYHGQVSIVIPIVDRGQHSVESARAEERKTNAFHQLEKDQLSAEVYHLYSQYESTKKVMDVFDIKRQRTIENKYYEAEDSFRKGLIDALTFLQIDTQMHENIDQIYMSRVENITAISNLNLLIGNNPEI